MKYDGSSCYLEMRSIRSRLSTYRGDLYPLAAFDANTDATTRFLRYLRAGKTRDTTIFSGAIDPSTLLALDVQYDFRRIGGTHLIYSARLLPAGKSGSQVCVDMIDPYNNAASQGYYNDSSHQSFDQCAERGFIMQTGATSYRGTPGTGYPGTADAISSPYILKTGTAVNAFDDLGRVTNGANLGDLYDPNDDVCTLIDYAKPSSDAAAPILNAPGQVYVQDCRGYTLAEKRIEYDGLPRATDPTIDRMVAQISDGSVTSSTVTRHAMEKTNGAYTPLGDIRQFDATYFANGNLKTMTRTRDSDGATSTATYSYDPFGLVATGVTSTASDPQNGALLPITTSVALDPLTLNVTSSTDANGMVRGATYDGFGRVLLSTVPRQDGSQGSLSSTSYIGFALVDTNGDGVPDSTTQSRTITQKVFNDAVVIGTEGTAPGRIGTTVLDGLGRPVATSLNLGADYQNQTLVVGARFYDLLGRVQFVADPFIQDDFSTSRKYGTTYLYNTDRSPLSIIRGPGVQPLTFNVDETNEIYPTSFVRSFLNNQEIVSWGDADSLLSTSNQFNTYRRTILNATGKVLESSTGRYSASSADDVLEDVVFGYDPLGHMSSMKRFKDPANKALPVTTTWHYDSLGWMTKLEEDGVAAQIRDFDSWGEITKTQWCDDLSAAPCPTTDRRSITRFDARGRMTHREDQSAGATVAGTVNDYTYDAGVNNATPPVTATNTLGRLATASWPTGNVSLSYDAFGRVKSKVFIDTTVTPSNVYVESHDKHDDGSEHFLHLLLPDNAFKNETVTYDFDSAARLKSAIYNDGVSSQNLFAASGTSPIYDTFGNITSAQYGLTGFKQIFAATGRRLLTDQKVTGNNSGATTSRDISFPTVGGVNPYDPVGRERTRKEILVSLGLIAQTQTFQNRYDGLGRLSASTSTGTTVSSNFSTARGVTYDPLGNIMVQTDDGSTGAHGPGGASLSYQPTDLDRVCGVAYFTAKAPQSPACNVSYDGVGNTLTMPTRTGSTRTFTYFPNGAVKHIGDGGSSADFAYDAFGGLQQLALTTTSADHRADKYFGALIKQRTEGSQSITNRQIPVPGTVATRHGPAGGWSFAFSDKRGTRFVTDQTGAYRQGINYQPFGEASPPQPLGLPAGQFFPVLPSAGPGTTNYTSEQFNGGDLLAALGVVNLGARVYDPVIGRFLSRDPIIQAKSPYAFADNDPINKSDPTGLCTNSDLLCVDNTVKQPSDEPELPDTPCTDCGTSRDPSVNPNAPNGIFTGVHTYSGTSVPGAIPGGSGGRGDPSSPPSFTVINGPSGAPGLGTLLSPVVGGTTYAPSAPYSSSSLNCSAATRICVAVQPTVKDYAGHLHDGTGWPVYRLGLDVDLGAYTGYQFDRPAGTAIPVTPGNRNLAVTFAQWLVGVRGAGARTDAFLYGHISKSKLLGGGFIQLAPDRFKFDMDFDDRKLRDAETWLQLNVVVGGAGTPFDTIFLGPTRVPSVPSFDPDSTDLLDTD